jgi:transposase
MDLPWQGQSVRIELTVRKLFCDNHDCSRRIFTEPLPAIAARYARKTCRLADALLELVLLIGGEAAARIAKTFGLLVSPDALLQATSRASTPAVPIPRVLGVDDFAFKKGHTYGTILIDHERRCPVDLLPDREAATLEAWLQAHPGIQIVTRDRAEAFRTGITRGAPQAVQVADRWHLLKNLGDALEKLLTRRHRHLQQTQQHAEPAVPGEVFDKGRPSQACPHRQ